MNKKNDFYFNSRSIASALLAFTVKELFPKLTLADGRATLKGFYYDFLGSFPSKREVLQEVEERMAMAVQKKLPIAFKEMSSLSAREYFTFHKEPVLADYAENSPGPTVFVLDIEGKLFLTDQEEGAEDLQEVGAIKLTFVEPIPGGVRIHGTAFPNKQILKEFVRSQSKTLLASHVEIGKDKSLFMAAKKGGWFWLPKGQKAVALLSGVIQEILEKKEIFIASPHSVREEFFDSNFFSSCQEILRSGIFSDKVLSLHECVMICKSEDKDPAFGLLDTQTCQAHVSYVFCKKDLLLEEVISCLRFMTKIFTILGLECRIVLFGRQKAGEFELFSKALNSLNLEFSVEAGREVMRIELRVQDRIGLEWPVSCVYPPRRVIQGDFQALPIAWISSVQRVLALMLEKNEGELPFLFEPVQIRILPVQARHQAYAFSLVQKLKALGFRAESEVCELKSGLSKALQEKIACIAVVGDRETEKGEVTLRTKEGETPLTLSFTELVKALESKLNRSDDSEL